MKNLLLILVIVILGAYLYHVYTKQNAPAPVVAVEATPAATPRRATPTPQPSALGTSGLQTHSLDRHGEATPKR